MKRLAIFSVFLMALGFAGTAFAAQNCKPHSCNVSSSGFLGMATVYDSEKLRTSQGSAQCYYCDVGSVGDNSCAYNDIVAIRHHINSSEFVDIKQCIDQNGDVDTWEPFTPGNVCKDSIIKSEIPGSRVYYKTEGNETSKTKSGDSEVFLSGTVFCKMIVCQDGYEVNADGTVCVDKDLQTKCENDPAGIWNGRTCRCATGTVYDPGQQKCFCTNRSQIYNKNLGKCVDQAEQNRLITECRNGGGTWRNNTCDCGRDKAWNSSTKKCELTKAARDRQNAAEAAARQRLAQAKAKCDAAGSAVAVWRDDKCQCVDPLRSWNGEACVLDRDVAACNQITGAAWNPTLSKCECLTPGYEIRGNQCVEGAALATERENRDREILAARAREERVAYSLEVDQTSKRIVSIMDDINNLKSGLGSPTVWRTEDGSFNTSRLVSDSVAGVVLGTAGGLITSNVIKKNQVKGGFDDISCTVGGQVVAGWGDEFTVGIH